MKRLEIIHLRSSGQPPESLSDQIRESIRAEGESGECVTLYRRDGLETDIAVHIHHPEGSGSDGASGLGLQLASALRTFGLVKHTLWEELR
ncbi:MAG: hypothetical protein GY856_45640 [bacterium]|nr:hypothetical protein [bacterium]